MRIALLILLTYLVLAAEGSILSGPAASTSTGSSWGAALSPVVILLAFTWLRPVAAGILSAFISLFIEMRYSAPPGTALMMTTFVGLLLTQVSIQRALKIPFVFVLCSFPIILFYDYALLVILELLSPTPAATDATTPVISLPPIWGSILVAARSAAIVAIVSVIVLGCRALLIPPREAESV